MKTIKVRVGNQELREPFEVVFDGWTEEDYFRLAPEDRPCEFVDGAVCVMSPVKERHDDVRGFLESLFRVFLRARTLGAIRGEPYTMRLRPGLDRQPDLFAIGTSELGRIGEDYLAGPADLVVEIVSKSSRHRDLVEKAAEYARHGVPEYWAIDPERRELHLHRLSPEGTYTVEILSTGRIEPAAFPGFHLEVSWLWADPLPEEYAILKSMLE